MGSRAGRLGLYVPLRFGEADPRLLLTWNTSPAARRSPLHPTQAFTAASNSSPQQCAPFQQPSPTKQHQHIIFPSLHSLCQQCGRDRSTVFPTAQPHQAAAAAAAAAHQFALTPSAARPRHRSPPPRQSAARCRPGCPRRPRPRPAKAMSVRFLAILDLLLPPLQALQYSLPPLPTLMHTHCWCNTTSPAANTSAHALQASEHASNASAHLHLIVLLLTLLHALKHSLLVFAVAAAAAPPTAPLRAASCTARAAATAAASAAGAAGLPLAAAACSCRSKLGRHGQQAACVASPHTGNQLQAGSAGSGQIAAADVLTLDRLSCRRARRGGTSTSY